MAFTYGFYNSQNGDRVYDADQFSSFLDGIVYDGVYEAVGDKFFVSSIEDEALTIQVGAGRAWLMHTWSLNDTNFYLTATASLDVYDRIDAVVLEVDKEIRENSIKIIEGVPSDSVPSRPVLKNEYNIRQYPLAYIYREHGTTTIPNTHAGTSETDTESAAECIKFMVGSSELPLCSALALAGIPSGGKIGQVLAKKSSESAAVGWYDIDKLPYDTWYLCDGITENNVIAAYKFVGGVSEAQALKPVNENKTHTLTKYNDTITWASSTGFYVSGNGGLNNSLLANSTAIKSAVIKYSITNTSKIKCLLNVSNAFRAYLSSGVYVAGASPTVYTTVPNLSFKFVTANKQYFGPSTASLYSAIICMTTRDAGHVYINSEDMDRSTIKGFDFKSECLLVGTNTGRSGSTLWYFGDFNIEYLALYDTEFTDDQQRILYNQVVADHANSFK